MSEYKYQEIIYQMQKMPVHPGSSNNRRSSDQFGRQVTSKTPSDVSSTNIQHLITEQDFDNFDERYSIPTKMTSSLRPFIKRSDPKTPQQKGMQKIYSLLTRQLTQAFRFVQLCAQITPPASEPALSHARAYTEPAFDEPIGKPFGKDLVRRHQKAEELLESLPLKFKKKMRNMIQEYEQERIELMKANRNLQMSLARLEMEMNGRRQQAKQQEACAGCKDAFREEINVITKQLQLYKQGEDTRLEIKDPAAEKLFQAVKELQKKTQQAQAQISRLKDEIAKHKFKSPTQKMSTVTLGPQNYNMASADPSQFGDSQFSQVSLAKAARPSRGTSPSLCLPKTPGFLNGFLNSIPTRRSRSKTSHPPVEQGSETEEGDFGKEKVIEKKRVRRLLKKIMNTTEGGRKQSFITLANQIGMQYEEADFISLLI